MSKIGFNLEIMGENHDEITEGLISSCRQIYLMILVDGSTVEIDTKETDSKGRREMGGIIVREIRESILYLSFQEVRDPGRERRRTTNEERRRVGWSP